MTSAFAGIKKPPGGATWVIATVGALASLALFTLAAWGLFKSRPWWQRAASAGAIVGLAALVPYGIAASTTGVSGPGLNSAIHIMGSAAVLLVLLVPALERRMTAWLSGGGRASEAVARG
jgi:peptidoglycan/LPS O-acetylase OafA/YrhL